MNANTDKKKIPVYYLFTGIAFLLLGIGNITILFNSHGVFEIGLGIIGVILIVGAIIFLKEYKRVRNKSS